MMRYGETHHRARHSDADVELCRQLHDAGMPALEISRKLEISRWTVIDWVNYRTRTGRVSARTLHRRRR